MDQLHATLAFLTYSTSSITHLPNTSSLQIIYYTSIFDSTHFRNCFPEKLISFFTNQIKPFGIMAACDTGSKTNDGGGNQLIPSIIGTGAVHINKN